MIGVGIISFNRPMYLRRLLKTLENQTSKNAEFWLFQDNMTNFASGITYARKNDISGCLRAFDRSNINKCGTKLNKYNMGVAIHQKESIDFLAEQYDDIIIVEDDVILSPNWIKMSTILFNEMRSYPNVFSFSPGFRRNCTKEEIPQNLDRLTATGQHMWTECFTADNWRRIQDEMKPYYDLVWSCDYRATPNRKILELHQSRMEGRNPRTPINRGVSQDIARQVAIELNNMIRAQMVVNRGMSIGRQGIHFNSFYYDYMKLGQQIPYAFKSDENIKEFKWDLAQMN